MTRDDIPTPALLLDLDRFERNVHRMAEHVARHGKQLRPHAKTHKCPEIARRQIAACARGDLASRSEEHTSELQSPCNLVCRLLLEKKNKLDPRFPAAETGQEAPHPTYTTRRYTLFAFPYSILADCFSVGAVTEGTNAVLAVMPPAL